MSRRYAFSRPDNNQKAIAEGLRAVGASVQFLHTVGKGCPDLLVGFRKRNYLFEVKNLKALRGKAQAMRLTEDEETWHKRWNGQAAVVTTLWGALDVLNFAPAYDRSHEDPLGLGTSTGFDFPPPAEQGPAGPSRH